jgi:hypothetical protein
MQRIYLVEEPDMFFDAMIDRPGNETVSIRLERWLQITQDFNVAFLYLLLYLRNFPKETLYHCY